MKICRTPFINSGTYRTPAVEVPVGAGAWVALFAHMVAAGGQIFFFREDGLQAGNWWFSRQYAYPCNGRHCINFGRINPNSSTVFGETTQVIQKDREFFFYIYPPFTRKFMMQRFRATCSNSINPYSGKLNPYFFRKSRIYVCQQ